jgi:antitoxin CcdA
MAYAAIRAALDGASWGDQVLAPQPSRPHESSIPTLRPYQELALDAWEARARRGVIALPTGAGKSRIGAAAIAKAQLRRNFALDRLLRHQNAHIMRMMSYRLVMTVPKRPVNLSLNIDLVERARRLTDNLSAQVETLLAEFVERREQEQQAEAERLERAAQAWNDFAERHGSFADEFSTL